jgi:glucose-1-phosphate cytidylyltransferase
MTLTAPRRHGSRIIPARVKAVVVGNDPNGEPLEIGGKPLAWHILKQLRAAGYRYMLLATPERNACTRRFFGELEDLQGHFSIHLGTGAVQQHCESREDWNVGLIDTPGFVDPASLLRRLAAESHGETLALNLGAGLSDVDLTGLLAFHREHGRAATVVVVRPAARFGRLSLEGDEVREFVEKPQQSEGWISSGLYVLEPRVFDYLSRDDGWDATLHRLARDGQLVAHRHASFWHGVETLKDRQALEELWQSGRAPWKCWD